MNIENSLLDTGCFTNNDYLKKYCKLVIKNLETPSLSNLKQNHHIIPVHVFKINKLAIDNSYSNIVKLNLKDHILAHYYLALCSSSDEVAYYNELAVLRMIGDSELPSEDKVLLLSEEKYDEIYRHSIEMNKKFHQGKTPWNKGLRYSVGPMTEERKSNISKKAIGRYKNDVWITRGNETKHVPRSTLSSYIDKGYVIGRLDDTYKKVSDKLKGKPSGSLGRPQTEYQKMMVSKKLTGVPKTQSAKEHMREAHKNKVLVSNDKTKHSLYIEKFEFTSFEKLGYHRGRLKKD